MRTDSTSPNLTLQPTPTSQYVLSLQFAIHADLCADETESE